MRFPRIQKVPEAERFEKFVTRDSDECWGWNGAVNYFGYGVFTRNSRPLRAHNVAWELANGSPPPRGLCVLHTCDTPPCTRNDEEGIYLLDGIEHPRWGHLWLGTQIDNVRDRHLKLRDARGNDQGLRKHPERVLRGERHHRSKATWEAVRDIRTSFAAGVGWRPLAEKYGMTKSGIFNIVRERCWKPQFDPIQSVLVLTLEHSDAE